MSPVLTLAVRWIVLGFLASLAAIIAYRLLNGEINTRGLLRSKFGADPGSASPARIQLLLFTIWTAGNFFARTMGMLGAPGPPRLAEVPESWLVGLGGSHLLYLGTKAFAFFGPQAGALNRARRNTDEGE